MSFSKFCLLFVCFLVSTQCFASGSNERCLAYYSAVQKIDWPLLKTLISEEMSNESLNPILSGAFKDAKLKGETAIEELYTNIKTATTITLTSFKNEQIHLITLRANYYATSTRIQRAFNFFTGDLNGIKAQIRASAFREQMLSSRVSYLNNYANWVRQEIYKFESRSMTGFLKVVNPITLEVKEESHYKMGVSVVWNPLTKDFETKTNLYSGIAGVFNPLTKRIEWKEALYSGVAGVWNPVLKKVEWKESLYSGIAGIWNPILKKVEWKEALYDGIVGIWDPVKKESVWFSAGRSGVTTLHKPADIVDIEYPYTSIQSFFGYRDDD